MRVTTAHRIAERSSTSHAAAYTRAMHKQNEQRLRALGAFLFSTLAIARILGGLNRLTVRSGDIAAVNPILARFEPAWPIVWAEIRVCG